MQIDISRPCEVHKGVQSRQYVEHVVKQRVIRGWREWEDFPYQEQQRMFKFRLLKRMFFALILSLERLDGDKEFHVEIKIFAPGWTLTRTLCFLDDASSLHQQRCLIARIISVSRVSTDRQLRAIKQRLWFSGATTYYTRKAEMENGVPPAARGLIATKRPVTSG